MLSFDSIEASFRDDEFKRVTATFASNYDIAVLIDGEVIETFAPENGIALVNIYIRLSDKPITLGIGREYEAKIATIFYEEEIIASRPFRLEDDVKDHSFITELIETVTESEIVLSGSGYILDANGEFFLADGKKTIGIEYDKDDGSFAFEYLVPRFTGIHDIVFVNVIYAMHRVFVASDLPLENVFLKLQKLPLE